MNRLAIASDRTQACPSSYVVVVVVVVVHGTVQVLNAGF